MDHQNALNRLRETEHLGQALEYALYGRLKEEKVCDLIELDWARSNKDEIIKEIQDELEDVDAYTPRTAFAYFTPKTDLCQRRMVFLPLKDLVVRNALVMLFAEYIEPDLSDRCFANRRATEENAKHSLLEPYKDGGWQEFCEWQEEENKTHSVLIRTDISSFFDSISHEYLIDAIERHLHLARNTPIMRLLEKLLKVDVMFYSSATGEIAESAIMHQGLTIGDATSSYLANIYLKDLDDAMDRLGNGYGRFNDDMRIFAKDRESAMHCLKILQQQLLKLGLNLNAAKTEITETQEQFEKIVSKNHDLEPSGFSDAEFDCSDTRNHTDHPLNKFKKLFRQRDLETLDAINENAKDFCKSLSAKNEEDSLLVPLCERRLWHINVLRNIVVHQRGSSRHATWLLVESATFREIQPKVRAAAQNAVCELILEPAVLPYARYRLLHHLLNNRDKCPRFFNQLEPEHQKSLQDDLDSLLSAPAFELNLIAIYFARVIGMPVDEIQSRVRTHCAKDCEPVKTSVNRLRKMPTQSSPQKLRNGTKKHSIRLVPEFSYADIELGDAGAITEELVGSVALTAKHPIPDQSRNNVRETDENFRRNRP